MNQEQREYVEQFLSLLEQGDSTCSIVSHAHLDDWAGNNFDFFIGVDSADINRYTTTRLKALIDRVTQLFPGILVNLAIYNTPRGGNGWKFSGIVSCHFS